MGQASKPRTSDAWLRKTQKLLHLAAITTMQNPNTASTKEANRN
jgi:hypothetical protein